MFDDNYNPKIIHFSEANIIDNKSEINKDIFGLCQILSKILTLGKYNSINYDKNKKIYLIFYKNQGKKTFIEESKFWMMIKTLYDINVPKSFIQFFHIIIKAKKSKEIININELLKAEWLNEINNEIKNYEYNFKKDFEELYKTIIEDNIKKNIINIDIKDILDENKEEISPFDGTWCSLNEEENSYEEKRKKRKGKEEEFSKDFDFEKETEKQISESMEKNTDKLMAFQKEENEDEDISEIILFPKKKIIADSTKLGSSKNKSIEEPKLKEELEIDNLMKLEINKLEHEHEEKLMKSETNISLNMKINQMDNYILRGPKKGGINILNNINDKEENSFKPRKDDFNYMKINIKNNENEDINQALIIFIQKLKDKIKQKYEQIDIKINFKEEKDRSFNIFYQIEPMDINLDDIEFLDDEFEDKMKNPQQFAIKVELIEGDKNTFLINKINEYYLIFNGISVDKEDFYEHLNILKEIVKNLYSI